MNVLAEDTKAVASHVRAVELSFENKLGSVLRAISIVGDNKVGKSCLVPFVGNIVHKPSRVGE